MNRQYGALSGMAIFLIVLNHAIHFSLQVAPADGIGLQALIILQALGAFAVPAFLFISGAFLAYAASEFSFALIKANLERILWPYLIWSSVFYALLFLTAGVSSPPGGYVKSLLVGYPYHFVPLLVFWYATAPALARVARQHGAMLVVAIGLYQACLLVLRFPGLLGFSFPSWTHLAAPPVLFHSMSDWAVYFPLGFVVSLHAARLRPALLRVRTAALITTLGLFVLGILNAFDVLAAPWARFAAPLPLMFVLPTLDRAGIPLLARFEFLGRRSYGIYLVHFVVMSLFVFAATLAGWRLEGLALVIFPILLALGLGASLTLMSVVNSMPWTRRVYRYLFGAVPPPVAHRPLARSVSAAT